MIYWINNVVYLPISGTNKYMKTSINGIILGETYTLIEILRAHPNIKRSNDLHDLIKEWGNKF